MKAKEGTSTTLSVFKEGKPHPAPPFSTAAQHMPGHSTRITPSPLQQDLPPAKTASSSFSHSLPSSASCLLF